MRVMLGKSEDHSRIAMFATIDDATEPMGHITYDTLSLQRCTAGEIITLLNLALEKTHLVNILVVHCDLRDSQEALQACLASLSGKSIIMRWNNFGREGENFCFSLKSLVKSLDSSRFDDDEVVPVSSHPDPEPAFGGGGVAVAPVLSVAAGTGEAPTDLTGEGADLTDV